MKLSIITINLNNCDGLQKTIDSVVSQTFRDFEWIIIDGCSTDGSKELIEQYAKHFVYWGSEPDNGIYNAMNKGTQKAKGEYVQYLNSGDYYIDEYTLENVFKNPLRGDVNYGNVYFIANGQVIEKRSYPRKMNLSFLWRSPLNHQAVFVKTVVAQSYPYKEQYSISADRAFFLELYVNDYRFHYIGCPIVCFDSNGIGSRPETLEQRRNQLLKIKEELLGRSVMADIEHWMDAEDDCSFVQRVSPLKWMFLSFKKLQAWKGKL